MGKVYILVLNWNGWQDTIECLESLFRLDYPDFRVVLCDNGSEDGSLEHIKAWADGRLDVVVPVHNPLRPLSFPPVRKPVPYLEHRCGATMEVKPESTDREAHFTIISTDVNLGYAGGNNVGLRYIRSLGDHDFIWLLNNDTVIHPSALTHLVRRIKERPGAGVCGSTIPYYSEPERLWARGGATYNKWFGFSKCIDLARAVNDSFNRESVERTMKYVAGASMLVSRSFLDDAGYLPEDYFLYFEELDWITGAKERYSLAYAPTSVVYHKVGASTGNGLLTRGGNLSPKQYMERSRILYTWKYFPFALPTVFLSCMAVRVGSFIKKEMRRILGRRGRSRS